MADIRLAKGDVWAISGERYHLDQVMGGGLLHLRSERTSSPLQLETDSGELATPTVDWLKQRFAAGEAKRADEAERTAGLPSVCAQARGDFNDIANQDERARMRQIVLAALDRASSYSLSDASLRRTLQAIWEAKPRQLEGFPMPAPSTVRSWIRTRGSTGCRPLAAMASRRGRSPRRKRLPPSVHKRIDRSARQYWAARHISMKMAFEKMAASLHRVNDYLADRNWGATVVPTFETFRRHVRSLEGHATVKARYGPKEADRRYKATGRGLEANRPLLLGALDHNSVDCHLVLQMNGWRYLGKPWLTTVIDINTRCIVGWTLSFEPASLYSVTECIKRANRPKAIVGLDGQSNATLADIFGRFDEIVVDNGLELAGVSFESAMTDVGTSIRWAPTREPTYKAIVERLFGTLNDLLFKKLPGGTAPISDLRAWDVT